MKSSCSHTDRTLAAIFLASLLTIFLIPGAAIAASDSLQTASGSIAGAVFFDRNGNGIRDANEVGLDGVTIQLTNMSTGASQSASTNDAGGYSFTALGSGEYTVTETDPVNFGSTTPNARGVTVGAGALMGIDFGDALPLTLTGVVFSDSDSDGEQGLIEPGMADALVEAYDDSDGDGLLDAGELLFGSAVSDEQGNYRIPNVPPGASIVRIRPPGGATLPTGNEIPLELISGQVAGAEHVLNVPLLTGTLAVLSGHAWHDGDGDELMDAGEDALAATLLRLYRDANGNGRVDAGELLIASDSTQADGSYRFETQQEGPVVLQAVVGSLPKGWVFSQSDATLAFTLARGQQKELDLGYFNPFNMTPMLVSEWKKEARQQGRPYYTPTTFNQLVARAQNASRVFPEVTSLVSALLESAGTAEKHARRQHAALQLNLASGRLLMSTRVHLPDLTQSDTIGEVNYELEGLLARSGSQTTAVYERSRQLAEAINAAQGIGYGTRVKSTVSEAWYRDARVTERLQPGGRVVDQWGYYPIVMKRWCLGLGDYDYGCRGSDTWVDTGESLLWSLWLPLMQGSETSASALPVPAHPGGAVDASLAPDQASDDDRGLHWQTNVWRVQFQLGVKAFYHGGVIEARQVLPYGREIVLGRATPEAWNVDVDAVYSFYLWNVTTAAAVSQTLVKLYLIDPDNDSGPAERVEVDSGGLVFSY